MSTHSTPNRARGRRLLTAVAAAAVAALALSACAAGDDSTGEGDAGGASDATMAIAVTAAPRSLDPAQLDGGTQAYVWASIYDTLLYNDNAGELQPNAAESWEYSDDGLTLTFKIREGMTFSSGDPVNAEAVATTLERNRVTAGQQQEKMLKVDTIEATDDSTVVLTFTAPDPAFLNNMALDAGAIGDPATIDDERTTTDPIGSGPYTLDASSVNGSSYVLKRRDDYWNVDAYPFETITVRVLADQTAALNALRTGEVDFASVPTNQVDTLKNDPNFNVYPVKGQAVGYLNLADRDGTKLAPLGDVRVRQAINFAIPREDIVKQILAGGGVPTEQVFSINGDAYDESLDGTYSYDPERAKELLAEAGYADGFDVNMPSTPLSLPYEPTVGQALADIGIRVTWDPVPPQNATASVVQGNYGMYFFLVGSDAVAAREVLRQLHSASQNPFKWTSPELTELENSANSELDDDTRAEKYRELNKYIVDEALFAPMFALTQNMVTSADVAFLGDGRNSFTSIRTFEPKSD